MGDDGSSGSADELDLSFDECGRIAGTGDSGINFSTRSTQNLLTNRELSTSLFREAVELDRIDTSGEHEADASFWLPAAIISSCSSTTHIPTTKNLCLLERVVAEIFRLHTSGAIFDAQRSGAEWWVQVRQPDTPGPCSTEPPPATVVATRKSYGTIDFEEECEGETIQFHFDKDEVLQLEFQVHCAPLLSTVTYLSNSGGPTLILGRTCSPEGAVELGDIHDGFLSFPVTGKHLVFDGRLLHAAPSELTPLSLLPSACAASPSAPRVSLLVNIWLNHQPLGIGPLDRSLATCLDARCTTAGFLSAKSSSGGGRASFGNRRRPSSEERLLNPAPDWSEAIVAAVNAGSGAPPEHDRPGAVLRVAAGARRSQQPLKLPRGVRAYVFPLRTLDGLCALRIALPSSALAMRALLLKSSGGASGVDDVAPDIGSRSSKVQRKRSRAESRGNPPTSGDMVLDSIRLEFFGGSASLERNDIST